MSNGFTKLVPLTQTQEGILAECLSDPDSTAYNVVRLFELSEKVDLKRLAKAAEQALLNHPYLFASLCTDDDGSWKAVRNDVKNPVVETVECTALPEQLITPFSLTAERLYRVRIFATKDGNFLLLDIHHIVYDGTSILILLDDINTAYAGGELKKEKCTGFDLGIEEQTLRRTDRLAADREYYDRLLANASNVSLPAYDAAGEKVTSGALVKETGIDLSGLSDFCRKNGVRRSAFFHAVFAYLLSEYNNAEEVLFATIYNGRRDEKLDRTVTMTVKTLPVACLVKGEDTVLSFVKQIGEQLSESMSHDLFSFAEICSAHDINSDILLAYQGDYLDYKTIGGEPVKVCDLAKTEAQQPLSVEIFTKGSKIFFNCEYYQGRYSEAFIEGFLASFEKAATEFLKKEHIREISILSEEAGALIDRFNKTDYDISPTACHLLFEEQVRRHPEKTAVTADKVSLTYAELNERADRIAGALLKRGLQPDETVGMLLPRVVDAVAAELGIMKAGGAFLPMLPDYPDDRIEYCMTDSGSRFVITTDELIKERTRLSEASSFTALSLSVIYAEDNRNEKRPEVSPENLAYCIYTSGSTGKPKGVMIEHRNLCNFVNANEKNEESMKYVTLGKTALSVAALSFDFSIMEIQLPLLNGLTLCIATEEEINNPFKLAALIEENQVDVMAGTPSFLSELLDIPESAKALRNIKIYDLGAEAFPPALFGKLKAASPEAVIVNGYGPTEATISCIAKTVSEGANITIGRPAANVKAWVTDRFLNILPPGARGELVIGGMGVGRGYRNLPEKTAEAFITLSGMRAYRTGDVVSLNADAELVFYGRKDNQVKLRGLRIELDEIENVMNTYPGFKQSVVLVIEPEKGDPFLCGYFTAEEEVDTGELKAYVSGSLARYMVPSVFVQLKSFPQTANGKIDKKALPVPERKADEVKPPENEKQKKIFELAASVIGQEEFGITTDLYEAGLSSLGAIRLIVLLSKAFDTALSVQDLKDNPTIEEIEQFILGHAGQETFEIFREYPVTKTQEGVYFESQAHPDTTVYNIPTLIMLDASLDTERLKKAAADAVNAHPYLLTRFFVNEEGNLRQSRDPDAVFLPDDIGEGLYEDEEAVIHELLRPFDMLHDRLIRVCMPRTKDGKRLFWLDVHHCVFDGSSCDILLDDIERAYAGESLKGEAFTGWEAALVEQKLRAGSRYEEAKAYYTERFGGMDEEYFPLPDAPDRETQGSGFMKIRSTEVSMEDVAAFRDRKGISDNALFCAAYGLVTARYRAGDETVFVTINNGRSDSRLAESVGMFVRTFPVLCRVGAGSTADYLKETDSQLKESFYHTAYSFEEISNATGVRQDLAFAYQGSVTGLRESFCEAPCHEIEVSSEQAKAAFALQVFMRDGKPEYHCEYFKNYYTEEFVRTFIKAYDHCVSQLLTCEELSQVGLCSDEELKILDSYNKEWDLNFSKADTAVSAFRKNAKEQPDKTAAVFKEKKYTYRELDELTDALAAKLYRHVSQVTGKTDLKEEVVAIITSRNENVFILPMAVVKAGMAYEPLDPGYPKERLNFMVKDAGACLLLAEGDLAGLLDEYTGEVLTVKELYDREAVSALPEGPKPEDLFIVLYTSGSTGTPKGCQIEHRNMTAYAYGVHNDFYTRQDRIAAYASFGFDVNMSDVFCTLINGGSVYLIPEEIRMDLGALAAYFDEAGITALLLTTQVGVQFLLNHPKLKTLRMLVMGGEKLPAVDPSKLSYTIVNGYGPTENCCGVSLFPIRAWEQNIPIGKPMSTIHAYVLDKTGHRLPAGAAGEYCLSGPQVTRGYLNRPDKTKEAYEPCPFNEFRMYHTGDIVRYRQNGDVEFVGRKDGQVKIRGFRIELTEVEAVIRDFEAVRDVTVQAFDYEGGGKFLAAFVVSDTALDIAALSDYIKSRKPAYMVPAAIMQIDKIPLTVNQKVDKKALPRPSLQRAAYVAPKGKTEEDFCMIFGSVLGIERVSAEADFFESGGSSILAMKVVIAAEKAGYSIVYNDVFQYTTPKALAGFVSGEGSETEEPAQGTSLSAEGSGALPETGKDGYDYRAIHALLAGNTVEAFLKGERQPLSDVLLLGGTGYLGCHVLRELILHHEGRLYCFIRPGRQESGEERLKATLYAYFGDDHAALFGDRITVIEGDATDADTVMAFQAPSAGMTVINCAASVKHFAKGDEIERVNVGSVRNLTAWCEKNGARLIHISTGSVAGSRKDGMPPVGCHFDEHILFMGQEIDSNQYVHSKFMAERHIYEEILSRGLQAKVLRVGNLAPREEDGEFQLNYRTNNYMNSLRALATLGVTDYGSLNEQTEFSPIDQVAKAVLALAETPKECVCFIAMNPHRPLMSDVIRQMNALGHPVRGAEPEEFVGILHEALSDNKKSEAVSCLIAYDSRDDEKDIGLDSIDHAYTAAILERLGFSWPETGAAYIRRFLNKLEEKEYFKV